MGEAIGGQLLVGADRHFAVVGFQSNLPCPTLNTALNSVASDNSYPYLLGTVTQDILEGENTIALGASFSGSTKITECTGVVVYGSAGAAAATVAPSSLSYSRHYSAFVDGVVGTSNTATMGAGDAITYSILPDINTNLGLSFDTSTGTISGTPSTSAADTDYTITATNTLGSTSAIISVRVLNAATTFVVNSAGDGADDSPNGICMSSGFCTLRAAIEENNSLGAGSAKDIFVPISHSPIVLATQLSISSGSFNYSIIAEDPTNTLSGGGSRHLSIAGTGTIILTNFKLENGAHATEDGGSIKITAAGTVTLEHLWFDNNGVTGGANGGGAVAVVGGVAATVNIFHSKFTNNSSGNFAGALYFGSSTSAVLIEDSLFETNASTVDAGAIKASSSSITLDIKRSLFKTNASGGGGGVIYITAGSSITITNNTFYGNADTHASNGGGAVRMTTGTATFLNNTFSNNTCVATAAGGALYNGSGTITLQNNIFDGNLANSSPDSCKASTNMTSAGGNKFSGADIASGKCTNSAGTNDIASDSNIFLSALADNGGVNGNFTNTMAISAASTALDGGVAGCPAVDQRGESRSGTCDAGAYELIP